MQGVTHHEAVSALRNAGSYIRMKVLREKLLLLQEAWVLDHAHDPQDVTSQPPPCSHEHVDQRSLQLRMDSSTVWLSQKTEAVVCNGNSINDKNRTFSEKKPEALMKNDAAQAGNQTMTIPRIILTHPSTSDDDVELLTHSPSRERFHGLMLLTDTVTKHLYLP
ncbi:uncharacterized protein LOC117522955 [Thalassophryne amazonica]|uniref:uncharacterized protein LOC117522955 n=1 Tax=Thalassophryne amazonica TaxID=390379 RepID=UPI0014718FB6|nr:uncharacterized protein LOC117522955 [Thalassophryne amazonica]